MAKAPKENMARAAGAALSAQKRQAEMAKTSMPRTDALSKPATQEAAARAIAERLAGNRPKSPLPRSADNMPMPRGQSGLGGKGGSRRLTPGGKGGPRPMGPGQVAQMAQLADMAGMQRMKGGGYLKKNIDGKASKGKTKGRNC